MIENQTSPAPQAGPPAGMTSALKRLKDRAARFRLAGPAPRVELDVDIDLLRLLDFRTTVLGDELFKVGSRCGWGKLA